MCLVGGAGVNAAKQAGVVIGQKFVLARKAVGVAGGFVGAAVDGFGCRGIAQFALQAFEPLDP